MKFSVVSTLAALGAVAFTAHIPHSKVMEALEDVEDFGHCPNCQHQPMYTAFIDENELDTDMAPHGVDKRGYYTCYNRQTNSVDVIDCQAIIDRINATHQPLVVPNGLCLTWWQGSCMSRLCAKAAAQKGLNMTSDSVVNELQGVILNDCVKVGLDGMAGDCVNMVSNCGTYRLTLEHHGSGVLGGPPPS
ncbi:hypothetical protein BKA67DRAFT_661912 [Truncatella angustata]|uniref:Uncharacterized protein n=1 Tax=Truncatella angustata TaxID=152316 RepID=A0A9P8ZTI5_9PEZI|nr:uncharacterized protein BKA67DRAFT_661912 [Truncatella angustata]KAH6648980.1 hypothetical protein BKA67DRAFT_661912 [Truncatella angustata]KAH8200752.1 hypothetical protein TruAng_005069 [Truncatella angustata]